jgi:ABC-type transport system involved in multi-copper enzyme maturation permease subunit
MIRFAWLQARTQTAVAVAALAAAAIIAAITGPRLLHFYDTVVATCGSRNDCASVTPAFLSSYRLMQVALPPVLLVAPALIGAFWGAPLVARELETGTFRLAWTQSVTRQRWLAAKLAMACLAGMAVAGLLSLILTWWFSPIDRVQMNQLTPAMFGVRGITPIGYAAFAFALGVTAGAFIRRTIPAMAATIVVFTGIRLAFSLWVRPYLIAPLRVTSALVMSTGNGPAPNPGAGAVKPGDLVVSDQVINGAGRVIGQNGGIGPNGELAIRVTHGTVGLAGLGGTCPNKFPALGGGVRDGGPPPAGFYAAVQDCINRLGIREVVTYQPLTRYWPLQWDETLIFTGLAIVLAGLCFWQVRRRLT